MVTIHLVDQDDVGSGINCGSAIDMLDGRHAFHQFMLQIIRLVDADLNFIKNEEDNPKQLSALLLPQKFCTGAMVLNAKLMNKLRYNLAPVMFQCMIGG